MRKNETRVINSPVSKNSREAGFLVSEFRVTSTESQVSATKLSGTEVSVFGFRVLEFQVLGTRVLSFGYPSFG